MTKPMTTDEAALYVARSASSLNKLRLYGGGPRYLKLGRSVRYAVADLDEWLADSRRSNTASAPQAKLSAAGGADVIIRDLLEHAVYDRNRNDECSDAVERAEFWLERNAA